MHQEDNKSGQATGQEQRSPARYNTTMVMDIPINTLNQASESLRAIKMGSTDILQNGRWASMKTISSATK